MCMFNGIYVCSNCARALSRCIFVFISSSVFVSVIDICIISVFVPRCWRTTPSTPDGWRPEGQVWLLAPPSSTAERLRSSRLHLEGYFTGVFFGGEHKTASCSLAHVTGSLLLTQVQWELWATESLQEPLARCYIWVWFRQPSQA